MIRSILQLIHRLGLIELFILFFVLVNVFTFTLYARDKRKTTKGEEHIRERTLLFFTLFCGGIGAFFGIYVLRHKTNIRKFKFVLLIGMLVVSVALTHVVYAVTVGQSVRFTEITLHHEQWPEDLNGYRIAFMTDFHVITDEAMADIVTKLNEQSINLLLLGGDFSMSNAHYRGTLREIAQTDTTDGIFGVDGNHDNYAALFAAMERYGITPLDNTSIQIQPGFSLAGVQDLWRRNPNIAAATTGIAADDFTLLLTHNPDVIMTQSTADVDLVLAGHTHAGQITLFGWPFYLLLRTISDYGTEFAYGLSVSPDGAPIFVSSGVGVYYSWPRIFARAEVVIITMYATVD